MALLGQITVNELLIMTVDSDPALASTPAPVGSLALLDNDVSATMWIKTGAADAAWSLVPRLANATLLQTNGFVFPDASGNLITNTARARWDGAGRFGFGLNAPATPQSTIHLDRGNATGSHVRMTAGTTTGQASGDGTEWGIDDAGNAEIRQYENSNINFYTNNTFRGAWAPNGQLLIGHDTPIDITGASTFPPFQIIGTGAVQMVGVQYSNDTIGPVFNILKSRGATIGAQGALTLNDEFGRHQFRGSDGTNFVAGASIRAFVDGTVSTGVMPGRLELMTTPTGSGTPATQLLINNSGLGIWTSAIRLGNTSDATAGNLRYTGTTLEAHVGGSYRDLVNLVHGEVSATGNVTTTSATNVLMTGMTTTPAAGTYFVIFSGAVQTSSNNASVFVNLYVGGSIVSHTEREATTANSFGSAANTTFPVTTCAIVTVNGSQAIEVRWRRSAGTATSSNRTLNWIRVNI